MTNVKHPIGYDGFQHSIVLIRPLISDLVESLARKVQKTVNKSKV